MSKGADRIKVITADRTEQGASREVIAVLCNQMKPVKRLSDGLHYVSYEGRSPLLAEFRRNQPEPQDVLLSELKPYEVAPYLMEYTETFQFGFTFPKDPVTVTVGELVRQMHAVLKPVALGKVMAYELPPLLQGGEKIAIPIYRAPWIDPDYAVINEGSRKEVKAKDPWEPYELRNIRHLISAVELPRNAIKTLID